MKILKKAGEGMHQVRSHTQRIYSKFFKILEDKKKKKTSVKSCGIIRILTAILNLSTLTEWALDNILLKKKKNNCLRKRVLYHQMIFPASYKINRKSIEQPGNCQFSGEFHLETTYL